MADSGREAAFESCQAVVCARRGTWRRIWTHDNQIINACLCDKHSRAIASQKEIDQWISKQMTA